MVTMSTTGKRKRSISTTDDDESPARKNVSDNEILVGVANLKEVEMRQLLIQIARRDNVLAAHIVAVSRRAPYLREPQHFNIQQAKDRGHQAAFEVLAHYLDDVIKTVNEYNSKLHEQRLLHDQFVELACHVVTEITEAFDDLTDEITPNSPFSFKELALQVLCDMADHLEELDDERGFPSVFDKTFFAERVRTVLRRLTGMEHESLHTIRHGELVAKLAQWIGHFSPQTDFGDDDSDDDVEQESDADDIEDDHDDDDEGISIWERNERLMAHGHYGLPFR